MNVIPRALLFLCGLTAAAALTAQPATAAEKAAGDGLRSATARTDTVVESYRRQEQANTAQNPKAATQPASAAEAGTLQSDVTQAVRRTKETNASRFITLNSENDMYGGGTDRNYTNGARITYFDMGAEVPEFFHLIDRAVPTFSINETTSISYSLGHNLYTPQDITVAAHQPNDRPWAAFLYGSAGLTSITKNHIDSLEATVGIVGPAALGEQVQKFVHRHLSGSDTPRGWRHQLKNEPALMLSWERSFPERYNLETFGWRSSAVPYIGATVGNVYTYASAGASFNISPYGKGFQDAPVRVRPAMPGTGAFVVPDNTFSWYIFGGVEGRAVARNIFLDGNTFTDSHDVDKKYFVADANVGLALTYGKTRLSYSVIYRTKEFDGQDKGDIFGTITMGRRF